MKKSKLIKTSVTIVVLFILSLSAHSQTYEFFQTKNIHTQLRLNTKNGEVYQVQDDGGSWIVNYAITTDTDTPYRYWLYPTQNFWTYILVDLHTGKIWQTQFTVDENGSRFSIPINRYALSNSNYSIFEVKPMISMYQFYLINKETGEMWKFQWSTDPNDDYRWIVKVN